MNREHKFIKNTLILSIGNFLPKAVTFITLPVLTNQLTKAEYGTFDLVIILSSLLLPSATLQIQTAAFRFLLDFRNNLKKSREIITNILVFVIPVSLVVLVFVYWLLPGEFHEIRESICIYLFVENLYICTGQIARGLSKNFEYATCSIFVAVNKIIFTFGFVQWLQKGIVGAVTAFTCSYALSTILLMCKMHLLKYFDRRCIKIGVIKEMVHYSWPMIPNNISIWIMSVSDRFMISIFMGTAANAVYAIANKIPSILTVVQSTFSMAWTESASITINDSDADDYYSRMFWRVQRVFAGFTSLVMAYIPIIFTILVRGNYDDAYCHIPILVIAMYYSNIAIYLGGIYVANMRTKSIGITTVLSACLNFLINILFIQSIGLYAASISTVVSYFVLMIYRLINVQKFQKIKILYHELFITNLVLIGLAVLCIQRTLFSMTLCFVIGNIMAIVLNKKLIRYVFQMLLVKMRN